MPASWPPSLPAPKQGSQSKQPRSNKITSPVDKGDERRRKKFSGKTYVYQVTIHVNGTQKDAFWTFWESLNDGVDPFTWRGNTVRFTGDNEPEESHDQGDLWFISFVLATVP